MDGETVVSFTSCDVCDDRLYIIWQ